MEPIDKAKELVLKFDSLVDSEIAGDLGFQFDYATKLNNAKKCALIVVEEILQTNPTLKGTSEDLVTMIVQTKAYWHRVHEEINKLT